MKRAGKPEEIAALVARIAPPAPPCFGARDIWRTYLHSAIDVQSQNRRNAGPLLTTEGNRALTETPDPRWSFCADCEFTAVELDNMRRNGTCRPDWWRNHTLQRVIPIALAA